MNIKQYLEVLSVNEVARRQVTELIEIQKTLENFREKVEDLTESINNLERQKQNLIEQIDRNILYQINN